MTFKEVCSEVREEICHLISLFRKLAPLKNNPLLAPFIKSVNNMVGIRDVRYIEGYNEKTFVLAYEDRVYTMVIVGECDRILLKVESIGQAGDKDVQA